MEFDQPAENAQSTTTTPPQAQERLDGSTPTTARDTAAHLLTDKQFTISRPRSEFAPETVVNTSPSAPIKLELSDNSDDNVEMTGHRYTVQVPQTARRLKRFAVGAAAPIKREEPSTAPSGYSSLFRGG